MGTDLLPFGTCDVCYESTTTKRYPSVDNRLLCWRHAPRKGYTVPEPTFKRTRKRPLGFHRRRKA